VCASEAEMNVANNHRSEDTGSVALGFPLLRETKKKCWGANDFEESSSEKKRPLFF
jgi:hypothetical protein